MKRDIFPSGDYEYGPPDIMAVGNFGVMYRAFWRPRGIHVALKHVPRKSEAGRKVEAEERGAMLQQQFGARHPNVVPEIYEHGKSETGDYYIAMELLDGRALSTFLREETITHEQAARVALWIAGDFLAPLHAFQSGDGGDAADMIVYSDLKPDHVFVLRDGSLRTLDFGITKRVQQANTSTVNPWASVPYASPRRLREGVVDRDADFWALGVMLYEMVAGHHPYPGLNAEAMSRAIERQDPPAALPPCNPGLAAIIRKLLAPQRHQSYQTGGEIAADLRTFLDGGEPAALGARLDTSVPTMKVPAGRQAPASLGSVPTDPITSPHRPIDGPAAALPATPPPAVAPPVPRRGRFRRFVRVAFLIGLGMMGVAELAASFSAEELRESVETMEASDVPGIRKRVTELRDGAPFGFAYRARVRKPLIDRLVSLGERPILDYRTELPIVSKPQWEQARESLDLARELRKPRVWIRGRPIRISALRGSTRTTSRTSTL
jgi:serine/threonine-protein kinase